jgi:hypothetical protein
LDLEQRKKRRKKGFFSKPPLPPLQQAGEFAITVPIVPIISVKNARAWVSMISYLKKLIKMKMKKKS